MQIDLGPCVGRGAFGKIYEAELEGEKIVVKLFTAPDPEDQRIDCRSEAAGYRLVTDVPGTPQCHGHSTSPTPFVAMELIPGSTLRQWLKYAHRRLNASNHRRTVTAALRALLKILVHFQNRGIVHGDIKPENIIVREGSTWYEPDLVLVDMGLVCLEGSQDRLRVTAWYRSLYHSATHLATHYVDVFAALSIALLELCETAQVLCTPDDNVERIKTLVTFIRKDQRDQVCKILSDTGARESCVKWVLGTTTMGSRVRSFSAELRRNPDPLSQIFSQMMDTQFTAEEVLKALGESPSESPAPAPEHAVARTPSPEHAVARTPSPEHAVARPPSPEHAVARPPSPEHAVARTPSPEHLVAQPPAHTPEAKPSVEVTRWNTFWRNMQFVVTLLSTVGFWWRR